MPTRSYYLKQGELLRSIAASTADPGQRQHMQRRASEYMDLAIGLPDDGGVPPIPPRIASQPVAQQQHQIQPDKGDDESQRK